MAAVMHTELSTYHYDGMKEQQGPQMSSERHAVDAMYRPTTESDVGLSIPGFLQVSKTHETNSSDT